MNEAFTDLVPSPIGPLAVVHEDGRLVALYTSEHERFAAALARRRMDHAAARIQLAEWFAGERTTFDLPLAPVGTPFQRLVWNELARIPFGETRTYADIARALGRPNAARAVGAANGANPLSIVVPCHRVIGADGALTGYAGGVRAKAALLAHEKRVLLAVAC